MAQVKKISVATIFGKIPLKELMAADEKGQTLPVMRVLGSAVASKTGTSAYGDWTCLLGTFEAIHAGDGSVHRAAQFYPPEIALIPILTALSQPGCRGVEFVIDISAKFVNDAKPGGSVYEYVYDHVLPPDANDPITRLADLASKTATRSFGVLKIAGPAPAETPAETPTPAPTPPRHGRAK